MLWEADGAKRESAGNVRSFFRFDGQIIHRRSVDLSPRIKSVWAAFLAASDRNPDTPLYDVFRFDDNKLDSDTLAGLVLSGKKRATASLLWHHETRGMRPPRIGDLSVVTDWDGSPLCVIETSAVQICAFQDVEESFAVAEGEGDLSLEYWRKVHWSFFGRECKRLGRERSQEMPVVCQQFKVIYVWGHS